MAPSPVGYQDLPGPGPDPSQGFALVGLQDLDGGDLEGLQVEGRLKPPLDALTAGLADRRGVDDMVFPPGL